MQSNNDLSTMTSNNANSFPMMPSSSGNVAVVGQGQMATMLGQMPGVVVGGGLSQPQQHHQQNGGTAPHPLNLPPSLPTPPEGAQQFCLRWNSYPTTVALQLAALRASEDFVDVTLACDGRQLRAHKLVLSACSPYFMQLFKSTPCQHPVIFLRDVGFRQLVALLEFMYAGEVNVSQAELPALLRTAEALQVRGLADTTANNNNNNTPPNNPCPPQPKTEFPQYGQQPVMNQNVNNPHHPHPHQQQQQQQQQQQMGMDQNQNSSSVCPPPMTEVPPMIPPSANTAATTSTNNNTTSNLPPTATQKSHSHRNSTSGQQQQNQPMKQTKEDDSESNDSNEFDMIDTLDHSKDAYMPEGNLTGQLEDTGQIFPDDPSFDMGDDGEIGNLEQSEGEEESSEDDDDGECKEFTYQSDASYSHEGIGDGEIPNGEGLIAGPSSVPPDLDLGEGASKDPSLPIPGGSGRNRLSRSLWPPGIPYHGPQQCPYCPRILSNVGNWRKHVLTMHFAREKVYKCRHCSSAFRTAEYLQKHYVRVHNYPQKMTRRKYDVGSGGGNGTPTSTNNPPP